jgi:predicted flap endonuclease-1-like 5' DNA nuclease
VKPAAARPKHVAARDPKLMDAAIARAIGLNLKQTSGIGPYLLE